MMFNADTFLGGIEKTLDLHIDAQGTNFLDENDLHDVLTKLPEEAFDLFAGPGLELSEYHVHHILKLN